ncbi:hypothetical protein BN59_01897 [Legionella massiliensis]|uniref:F-box domain-containing protein n=1 Tax=Legionella massiliensis TaxID=1034943 RepID=A0A078L0R7_9GAMM|nr:hypothetical protein [Legionella massiliensis]CDZ77613.1 hypothetical protein BN59_01897 [Legionella massiliensis]CEE13351.1 hypothetical protein BN1094_01897 [Legionella massiliensis]
MPIKNDGTQENEKQPEFFDTFPHEVTLEVLRHLNNRQLAAIERVNKDQFSRLVNVVEKEHGLTTENILPNQMYYILGNTVEMNKIPFGVLTYAYTAGREVPNKEIKDAAPKSDQIVRVFRTKEEAEKASSVQEKSSDRDPMSARKKPVVFAVKLKEGQEALEVEFQQEAFEIERQQETLGLELHKTPPSKSKVESARLSADCFKIIAGYNPSTKKEIQIAKENSQVSSLSFFQKAEKKINDALSALAGNQHRPK